MAKLLCWIVFMCFLASGCATGKNQKPEQKARKFEPVVVPNQVWHNKPGYIGEKVVSADLVKGVVVDSTMLNCNSSRTPVLKVSIREGETLGEYKLNSEVEELNFMRQIVAESEVKIDFQLLPQECSGVESMFNRMVFL